MNNVDEKIISLTNNESYKEALKLPDDNVLSIKTLTILGSDKIVKYSVIDQDKMHSVQFIFKNSEIISMTCDCNQEKCKHIAKVLLKNASEFFPNIVNDNNKILRDLSLSTQIIDDIYEEEKLCKKKRVKLEVEVHFIKSLYARNGLLVSMKLGAERLYNLGSRINEFFEVYASKCGSLVFGKEFEYNPNYYYFDDADTKILDFCSYIVNDTVKDIYIPKKHMDYFLSLFKNKPIKVYPDYEFTNIIYDNPYSFKLEKIDDIYRLNFDESFYDYRYLDMDKKYVIHEQSLFSIPKEIRKFMDELEFNQKQDIVFKKDYINKFYALFSKYFNKSILIDENIKKTFSLKVPKVHMYFDLETNITCNLKFEYEESIINYFDEESDILRNYEYEEGVIDDLRKYGFFIDDNIFYLNDIDNYEYFIESGLPILSKKYIVYTTEKLDNFNIIKDFNISTHFSIGADNIFKYEFTFDEDKAKELKKVFDAMNDNKKYYRFKNGSILKLENKKLEEFKSLTEEMNIDINSIESSKEYTIPKYRALYLDSLKEKNDLIETNNLFDDFVSQFKNINSFNLELDSILREYQKTGVKWLYNIYSCGFGAILADEMGLGKSIQIICFLKQILKKNKNFKILITSPTSLIYNWENEFKKFGPELKYLVVAGTRETRKELFKKMDNYNIFITTYGLIKEDKEKYLESNFEVVIIDEAQMIKNPKTEITRVLKQINGNVKIGLTGTPLENTVTELWSIFDFIMPGYLNTLSKFNEKYSINEMNEENKLKLENLNKQISPFILRRKKKDVLNDLPEKLENNIYLELNDKQKLLYTETLKNTKEEMNKIIKEEGFLKSRFKILSLITKLRQICIDPRIIDSKYTGGSSKMEEVCKSIEHLISDEHKILIFTSYKKALELVKEELDKKNITSYVIDGSVSSKKRQELVTKFNNDNTNVFLIMLKAGGTGLNLTGADTVIHLDLWWNPQVEAQATDRAHRIGQKHNVEVIKFICKGTIEEKILELQEKKKELSDTLIEGDNRSEDLVSSLTEEEFRNLLSYSE